MRSLRLKITINKYDGELINMDQKKLMGQEGLWSLDEEIMENEKCLELTPEESELILNSLPYEVRMRYISRSLHKNVLVSGWLLRRANNLTVEDRVKSLKPYLNRLHHFFENTLRNKYFNNISAKKDRIDTLEKYIKLMEDMYRDDELLYAQDSSRWRSRWIGRVDNARRIVFDAWEGPRFIQSIITERGVVDPEKFENRKKRMVRSLQHYIVTGEKDKAEKIEEFQNKEIRPPKFHGEYETNLYSQSESVLTFLDILEPVVLLNEVSSPKREMVYNNVRKADIDPEVLDIILKGIKEYNIQNIYAGHPHAFMIFKSKEEQIFDNLDKAIREYETGSFCAPVIAYEIIYPVIFGKRTIEYIDAVLEPLGYGSIESELDIQRKELGYLA